MEGATYAWPGLALMYGNYRGSLRPITIIMVNEEMNTPSRYVMGQFPKSYKNGAVVIEL